MARKPTGNPMGRPRKVISEKEFVKLCQMQCTKEEIAGWFECSEDTLEKWCKQTFGTTFTAVFKEKRAGGLISMRRSGFEMAKTNPSVHIFYAKNYLGMTDKVEQTVMEVEDLSTLAQMLSNDSPVEKEEDKDNG